ncbi:MAG: metal-sensing transcriptional repressor [Armatimonadota bacterium]
MAEQHRRTKQVLNRLARIEGHSRGIRRMVDEGRECEEILLQISAVQAAWKKLAEIIIEDHIEVCMAQAATQGAAGADAVRQLKSALASAHLIGSR